MLPRHSNAVTPPEPYSRQDTISAATSAADGAKAAEKRRGKRASRFAYKDHAHELLSGIEGFERTCSCFRVVRRNHNATIQLKADGTATYGGLARCGNIWACPVCAPHIAAQRASMIELVLSECLARGDDVHFVTFTCSHNDQMLYSWLLPALNSAISSFKSYRAVKAALKRLGYIDLVSSKDATWGLSGWHPHRHEIWLYDPDKAETTIDDELPHLRSYWLRALEKQGLTADLEIGLKVSEKKSDQSTAQRISDYCTKISAAAGLSMELASSATKKAYKKSGKAPHYTPFELLILSSKGDYEAGRAWVEYVKVMRGKRQIVMGRYLSALLKRLQLDEEFYDDQLLVNNEDDDITDSVDLGFGCIRALCYYKKMAYCLDIAETRGLVAAADYAECLRQRFVGRLAVKQWAAISAFYPDWFDPLMGMEDLIMRSTYLVGLGSGVAWENRRSYDEYSKWCV